jgi:hypothetical protein
MLTMTLPEAQAIDFGEHGRLVLDTPLSQAQVNKFKGLMTRLIVVDNTAYLRMDELHGVLITTSRQQAQDIVMANMDLVKPYLVTDRVKFEKYGVSSAIKPAGLYLLLDHLAAVNAKKAPEYRASLVLLAYIISRHPGVMLGDWQAAKEQFQDMSKAMRKLKNRVKACQLTGHRFHSKDEKHVHHIEGKAENPDQAADKENLMVVHGWVHDDYHSWVMQQGMGVSRASLWFYANRKGYSTEFLRALPKPKAK